MADEQYKWLNRDTAERLLRGEPLEAVDADVRAAADRLTGSLDALTVPAPSTDDELRGEEAALAAFRRARAERVREDVTLSSGARAHATAWSADAGLVRLGRAETDRRSARWGRPLRSGMAATLAAGMLGGLAVVAGAGVLPTPFRDEEPNPASTASVPATPEELLGSPSPKSSENEPFREPSPSDTAAGADGRGVQDDTARGGGSTGQPGADDSRKDRWQGSGDGWRGVALSACRDVRDGKKLDSGSRRGLEGAAGGKGKVEKYCKVLLGGQDGRTATGTSDRTRDHFRGRATGNGRGTGSGRGGDGKGDGNGHARGGNGGDGKGRGGNGGNGKGRD